MTVLEATERAVTDTAAAPFLRVFVWWALLHQGSVRLTSQLVAQHSWESWSRQEYPVQTRRGVVVLPHEESIMDAGPM